MQKLLSGSKHMPWAHALHVCPTLGMDTHAKSSGKENRAQSRRKKD